MGRGQTALKSRCEGRERPGVKSSSCGALGPALVTESIQGRLTAALRTGSQIVTAAELAGGRTAPSSWRRFLHARHIPDVRREVNLEVFDKWAPTHIHAGRFPPSRPLITLWGRPNLRAYAAAAARRHPNLSPPQQWWKAAQVRSSPLHSGFNQLSCRHAVM